MKHRPRKAKGKCVHFRQYSRDRRDVYCALSCSERAAFRCNGKPSKCAIDANGYILDEAELVAGLRAVCRSTGGG